ncbi:unnamed protein product [Aphanomyces euteiches]|uniref:BTB domain-containing protein n=1 Tax=Aphanomyces euteiches TaxID=100861 RepID=A0A6G0WKN5_9STRA|nr:hypothetical protein Ae201684_014250 [Aphanomyces euteiches]KAH9068800.1 hypothetical protein Ae201684P_004501 [Aphanomyces euteiches]KAH9153562.1 hypothetical protein AeRB84_004217 [Aphanomyces euteiches]
MESASPSPSAKAELSPTSSVGTTQPLSGTPNESAHHFVVKKGRPLHSIWSVFTDKVNAHLLSEGPRAPCKHCNNVVLHHNKTACVERHLKKCVPFLTRMHALPTHERPDWFNNPRSSKKSLDAASLVFSIKKQQQTKSAVYSTTSAASSSFLHVAAAATTSPTVKLNVGGSLFETTKATLLQHEHSFFHDLLVNGHPRADGTYFLDLDPKSFGHVMDFLRFGELSVEGLTGWDRRKLAKTMAFLKLQLPPWDPLTESAALEKTPSSSSIPSPAPVHHI